MNPDRTKRHPKNGHVDAGNPSAAEISRAPTGRPLRVLQIVGTMDRGGVESWLMQVLRAADPAQLRLDFLVFEEREYQYSSELRERGARVLVCPPPKSPRCVPEVWRLLRRDGPFDVVHCHTNRSSGLFLLAARLAGVPVRIAHGHNDFGWTRTGPSKRRRISHDLALRLIRGTATHGLACSEQAAGFWFGKNWRNDPRIAIHYCSLDLAAYTAPFDRVALRREFGIPEGSLVVGHVGSFLPVKNQAFVLQIAAELLSVRPESRFVLVGDGITRPAMQQEAIRRGLGGRLLFPGSRPDVPDLLRGVFDLFVFPSLHEGLGLALIEAQAAGLPCIVSDVITPEAFPLRSLVRPLPLSAGPATWSRALIESANCRLASGVAVDRLRRSPFSMENGLRDLERIYSGEGPTGSAAPTGPAGPTGQAAPTRPAAPTEPSASASSGPSSARETPSPGPAPTG